MNYRVGIVGNGSDKFTALTEAKAKILISHLLGNSLPKLYGKNIILVSGHSPVGGIDIWAEEYADSVGIQKDIKIPQTNSWSGTYGYRARNLDIAKDSDKVHVIVVSEYPPSYTGRRFKKCYHCGTSDHVKSGACWTAIQARKLGKQVQWHIITV